MPINQTTLAGDIKAALLANIPSPTSTPPNDQITAITTLANAIATAIVNQLPNLTITLSASSTLLAPAGTAGGPVTGAATGVIS